MLFNSFEFLIFFPVVTAVYFLLPGKIQWIWLLVMSYFFYMNWHAEYALLMAACTVVTYACGRIITALPEKKHKKLAMSPASSSHRPWYFKYRFFLDVDAGACATAFHSVTHAEVSIFSRGHQLYIFPGAVLCDRRVQGRVKAERKTCSKYALFVSFFPQRSPAPDRAKQPPAPQVTAGTA